jgi:hypothetical protein
MRQEHPGLHERYLAQRPQPGAVIAGEITGIMTIASKLPPSAHLQVT